MGVVEESLVPITPGERLLKEEQKPVEVNDQYRTGDPQHYGLGQRADELSRLASVPVLWDTSWTSAPQRGTHPLLATRSLLLLTHELCYILWDPSSEHWGSPRLGFRSVLV